MRNHPDYQGNSGILLAVGVDLKTNKQTKKRPPKTKKPTLKNKTQSVHGFLFCSNGTQMSLLQDQGASSTPPQEISQVFKDSWLHRVVNLAVRRTRPLSEKLPD